MHEYNPGKILQPDRQGLLGASSIFVARTDEGVWLSTWWGLDGIRAGNETVIDENKELGGACERLSGLEGGVRVSVAAGVTPSPGAPCRSQAAATRRWSLRTGR